MGAVRNKLGTIGVTKIAQSERSLYNNIISKVQAEEPLHVVGRKGSASRVDDELLATSCATTSTRHGVGRHAVDDVFGGSPLKKNIPKIGD